MGCAWTPLEKLENNYKLGKAVIIQDVFFSWVKSKEKCTGIMDLTKWNPVRNVFFWLNSERIQLHY